MADDALSRNPSSKEEVIEIGMPPPLELAFIGAVNVSFSTPSVHIQLRSLRRCPKSLTELVSRLPG